MSTKPAEAAAAPPKSKKMLLIVGIAVLVLALAGGGGWFYISKQRAAALEAEDEEVVAAKPTPKGPPTYLPMDNMVVNLADPGGEKVAQIGITLELTDSHATDKVKQYLPTIRSSVLMLVSQRTAQELFQREGKEKLAADILKEAARPFGGGDDEEHAAEGGKKETASAKKKKKKGPHEEMPVQRVLFSSFIVQ